MNNYRKWAAEVAKDVMKEELDRLEKVIAYVAYRTSTDWVQIANKVMDDYYADYVYTTRRYKQTFSMRESIVPILGRNADGFEAGVLFDYSRMSHGHKGGENDITSAGEFWILNNFIYGYHGNENYTTPSGEKITRHIYVTNPPAGQVLDDYYQAYDAQIDRYVGEALRLFQ